MKIHAQRNGARAMKPLSVAILALAAMLSGAPAQAVSGGAEIVYLVGKGERRDYDQAPWQPIAVSQKIPPGTMVRTLGDSQMALLMPDRSQFRLQPNSQFQIDALA